MAGKEAKAVTSGLPVLSSGEEGCQASLECPECRVSPATFPSVLKVASPVA